MALACLFAGCDACSGKRSTSEGRGLASDATTRSVLATQSSACPACAARNGCLDPSLQGGVCELTEGQVPVAVGGILDGGSSPLDPAPPNAGYTANCLRTLHDLFASGCANSLSLTPCLCGDDPAAAGPCLEGLVPPAGPMVPDYANSFHTASGKKIQENFTVQTFGAGQANALVQCLVAFNCLCCLGLEGGGC
jgi:hypothetical protein